MAPVAMSDTPKLCAHDWWPPMPIHFNGTRTGWSTRTHHVTWCEACGTLGVKQKVSKKHSKVIALFPGSTLYEAAQEKQFFFQNMAREFNSKT